MNFSISYGHRNCLPQAAASKAAALKAAASKAAPSKAAPSRAAPSKAASKAAYVNAPLGGLITKHYSLY